MRVGASDGGLSVHAIAGSYVVLLGMSCTAAARKGLLGFAIERHDHAADEKYFLRGFKVFEETRGDVAPGQSVSSLEHPFQTFLWSDFTANPGVHYTYRIVALYGKPKKLEARREVEVSVVTEPVDLGVHAVFFNRGVAASQAYARRFGNVTPDRNDPNAEYWVWLSRGLEEAMFDFIRQATGPRTALRAAVYEFNYPYALDEFQAARARGADVRIVYDRRGKAKPNKNLVWQATEPAVHTAGLDGAMIPRKTNSAISHNKFIVLLEDGRPKQVWTGSTNYTWGGVFGQSNVGHVVRDENVASAYHDYWSRLSMDPSYNELRGPNEIASPQPPNEPNKGITPVFFPRSDSSMMNWYVKQAERARDSFFLTAAFGVHKEMARVLSAEADHLRYVLLESETRGTTIETTDRDVKIAVGSSLKDETVEERNLVRWVKESTTNLNTHVRYAHTKFMIVDAMTDAPVVVTGSGNFSEASVKSNDENMLVIVGDTHVADIYLGEFMRLFNHHYFRYLARKLGWNRDDGGSVATLLPSDTWAKRYFDGKSPSDKQRQLFRYRRPRF